MNRLMVRGAAALPLLAAFSITGGVTAVGPATVGCASASSQHHAALVIERGDGRVLTFCVGFGTAQASGQYLLEASRVELGEVAYGSLGQAVCQLDAEPVQYPPSCWTGSSPYWVAFLSRGGGAWHASSVGVSNQMFGDGDAEGFRFLPQGSGATPPSPAGACAAASVAPGNTGPAPSSTSIAATAGGTPAASVSGFQVSAGLIAAVAAAAALIALLVIRLVRDRAGGPAAPRQGAGTRAPREVDHKRE